MNNNNMFMGHVTISHPTTSSDLQLSPSPDPHDIFRSPTSDVSVGNVQPISTIRSNQQNLQKKRTKMIRFHNGNSSSNSKAVVGVGLGSSGSHLGGIVKKKPDPSAPQITHPCTECGKRFWSWKALFGHMRCHPERPWRGINPPPNMIIHHARLDHDGLNACVATEEDEYVGGCLLMLAKSPTNQTSSGYQHQHHSGSHGMLPIQISDTESQFKCSSCKKVFGSHQALGRHRASHKNVKGCFAITRNEGGGQTEELGEGEFVAALWDRTSEGTGSNQQHKCSICSRIFSNGQELGGHKRLHWEKDGVVPRASTSVPSQGHLPFRFDLNLPAHLQDDHTCSSADLDLRLGL